MERPIAVIDTETTGTNTQTDRICSIYVGIIREWGGIIEPHLTLINPLVPIPAGATAVHGITDEMVKDSPTFAQIASKVLSYLEESDYLGYNILQFDLPLIEAELKRCGFAFDWQKQRIFDAQQLFYRQHPRTLTGAVRVYLDRDHEGAHGAEADAVASLEVLLKQREQLGVDDDELARLSRPDGYVDSAGKFKLIDGEITFTFSKHRGCTLKEVALKEPSFLNWMRTADFAADTIRYVEEALREVHHGILPPP